MSDHGSPQRIPACRVRDSCALGTAPGAPVSTGPADIEHAVVRRPGQNLRTRLLRSGEQDDAFETSRDCVPHRLVEAAHSANAPTRTCRTDAEPDHFTLGVVLLPRGIEAPERGLVICHAQEDDVDTSE